MNTETKHKYRLLTPEDIILSTDEHLNDDCETWEAIGDAWPVGNPYCRNFFQPMRRIEE